MKRLFIALLVFGLAFAVFPEEIPGTGLELLQEEGELDNGVASYATADEVTVAIVTTEPLTVSEWEEIEDGYISREMNTKVANGVEYYYLCETLEGKMQCYMDVVQNEVYYLIYVSVLGGTESQALDIGVKIHQAVIGSDFSSSCCSTGLILAILSLFVFFRR